MATRLEQLYGTIDKLELVVGLFAEQPPEDALFGDLMRTMVAYDAFTQIYTNPLLSQAIHCCRKQSIGPNTSPPTALS